MNIHNLCRVKNITGVDIIIRGHILSPGIYYEITDIERQWWAFDSILATAINAGDIVVNDGTYDYVAPNFTVANALELLRLNYTADAVRIQNTQIDVTGKSHDKIIYFKQFNPIGALDPYKDRIALKKLADLGNSGRAIEISFMKDETKPNLTFVGTTYTTAGYIAFPGTGGVGSPASTRIVAWSSVAGKFSDYRLYDLTNAQTISELVLVVDTNVETMWILTPVNPFPIDPAIVQLQCRKNPDPALGSSANIAALEILF